MTKGGTYYVVPSLNTVQLKPAHPPSQQQNKKLPDTLPSLGLKPSIIKKEQPINIEVQQKLSQGGTYNVVPHFNTVQLKPAHPPGQQQKYKKLPDTLPSLGSKPQTVRVLPGIIKKEQPNNDEVQQKFSQGGKWDAVPPFNIVQLNPAYQPCQQQNKKHPDTLPSLGSKPQTTRVLPGINKKEQPNHVEDKQKIDQGGKCDAVPPLKKTQTKPVHQPCQQQIPDQKSVTQDFKTNSRKLPKLVNTWHPSSQQKNKKLLRKDTLPMSPEDVLERFGKIMTEFECDEILTYPEIWYLGHITKNYARPKTMKEKTGTQTKVMHIAYRYEVQKMLGEGTYGQVYKCLDHKTNELVAIKVIRPDSVIKTELDILDFLRKKDKDDCYNIVHMKEHFRFRNQLCIVFELLGQTLWNVMKDHREGMSLDQVRNIARELLKCLSMLEREKIIHADLKPENIMQSLEKPPGIRVIDFGFSCFEHLQELKRVGTSVYRAPEVMVRKRYSTAIDMWSLGCILIELYTGQHPFYGHSEVEIMSRIMEVLGKPPTQYTSLRKELFFDFKGRPLRVLDRHGELRVIGSKNLASILNTSDELFLDFIQRCLTWDPGMRLTAQKALQHKWIQEGPKAKTRQHAASTKRL
ncbi:dual specificity tyrosine-phosphorylation-regulated kinase 4-like [Trichomycterus rosablanca]|uniref:dual specificity tyrosine-phosphorylation-regulated kinase 4-like n=1 Tax=Trichomycterus rosablanca TaxID=2290929 RepID=UPI002F357242